MYQALLWALRCHGYISIANLSLEEGVAALSSIPAWITPWTEEPDGLQSMGSQRVRHDWGTEHTHTLQPNASSSAVWCFVTFVSGKGRGRPRQLLLTCVHSGDLGWGGGCRERQLLGQLASSLPNTTRLPNPSACLLGCPEPWWSGTQQQGSPAKHSTPSL